MEIVSLNGKDTEKIKLELQNQFSDRLTVHLWGKYDIFVHDATQNLIQEKSIICVLRFGKLIVFKDSVSTAYGVTEVSLNPEMVEVEAFSKLLNKRDPHIALVPSKPVCLIPEIFEKYRFFKPIIQKSIIEVLETEQLDRCIVICIIAAIDYDMGWYYMSCKICCQKVLSVPSDKMVYVIQKSQVKKKYYCAKCKTFRLELLPRHNLQLVVLDNTGHTKFLLLDNLAEELLGIPCVVLSGSSADQIEDPLSSILFSLN